LPQSPITLRATTATVAVAASNFNISSTWHTWPPNAAGVEVKVGVDSGLKF